MYIHIRGNHVANAKSQSKADFGYVLVPANVERFLILLREIPFGRVCIPIEDGLWYVLVDSSLIVEQYSTIV
jgi:hypothetical protein